ncbi:MAG: hypothetical protein E1N59_803 [Puniceicoccaceae bacterium 5H]|nr:MAG: hypothetical protein E1N59_803 [Puniceicoccaceae bacterium 5H]
MTFVLVWLTAGHGGSQRLLALEKESKNDDKKSQSKGVWIARSS